MINDAYGGCFQLILTKEVSRFSRNILDTIAYTRELRSIGVGVLFVTDRINTLEPESEMLLSFLASLAQEESRRISSRVVWGQTRQMEKGIVFGRSLLGYDVTHGEITINPKGAELVRLIFEKYTVEQQGTSEIARLLTQRGYQTSRGNTDWSPSAIVKILRNEKYIGMLIQRKTYTPDFLTHDRKQNTGAVPQICIENHHVPIISRDIWDMAQARLHSNKKHTREKTGHSSKHLFSGKIQCGECGSRFVGRYKYLKDGTKIRRWSCGTVVREGTASCSVGKLVRDDDALQMLKTALQHLQLDYMAIADHVTTLVMDTIISETQNPNEDPDRLRAETERIMQKREAVLDSYFSSEISKEDMQSMIQKYDGLLDTYRQRIIRAEHRSSEKKEPHIIKSNITKEIVSILHGQTDCDIFYKTILHNLTVFKDRHVELRFQFLPQIFHFSE